MQVKNKGLIVQFCKAPVPGKVKTRMHTRLSKSQACELHKFLALRVFSNIYTFSKGLDYQLWVSDKHEWFDQWLNLDEQNMFVQKGEGLGDKLLYTAKKAFDTYSYVVFVGSDCPFVDSLHLTDVCTHIEKNKDLVFIPADDGGYVLIALKRNGLPLLTSDILWGTDQVLDQSIQIAEALKLDYAVLDSQYDIDRPEDLMHLKGMKTECSELDELLLHFC